MRLNNEMCDMALNNESLCTIYDNNYVLLRKSMPVTDDKLEWYINSLKNVKNSGVNIATIVDYKLLPETKKVYGEISYTQGIFLEERAKGKSFNSDSIYLRSSRNYDFNEVICRYLKMVTDYIEELELRAEASQEMYMKFVRDCKMVEEAGLSIDPKPLNFFFDKNVGYTIIDVVPNNDNSLESYNKYFPQYMFSVVFGYGKPNMSIDFSDFSVLPQEMIDRLNNAGKILEAKIVAALRKFGFGEEEIVKAVSDNRFRYETKSPSVEIDDMEDFIAREAAKLKEESKSKGTDKRDFFTISV